MTARLDKTGAKAGAVPQRVAAALRMADVEVSDDQAAEAIGFLRAAGTSIRTGREREPAFAPHVPNTADAAQNFSYSAEGSPGHEECCDRLGRCLYMGERAAARIPWIHGIVIARNGRDEFSLLLLSADEKTRAHRIAWEEITDGTWGRALGISLSPDHKIVTAAAAAIDELAWHADTPRLPAAVTPAARTADGHVPEPVIECMPDGYWEQPDTPEADRLQARATQAEIAARRPKIALTWGASAGSFFGGPLKLRQSGTWELTGGPRLGKTTTLMLAASVWGYPAYPPDGMLVSWDQTTKGAGRYLGELGIFPAFFDETGTSDNGPEEWARFHYGASMGASRQTAKTRGSMGTNRTPGWQGFLFTTGNGTTTEGATAGKNAGVAARVVTLSGEFTGNAEECARLDAAILADYGHIGPAIRAAVTVDEFGRMYAAALDSLDTDPGGIAGTLAGKAALGVAGARAIDLVLGTGTAIGDAAHRGALDYLATLDAAETDRERILRRIAELLSSEKVAWPDSARYSGDQFRSYAGLLDDGHVFVYPATWAEITASTGVGNSAKLALADMHARGELIVPARRREAGGWQTEAPRWAGRRALVYKITLAAIDASADTATSGSDDSDDGADTTSGSATGSGGATSTAPTLTSGATSATSSEAQNRPSTPATSTGSGGATSTAPALTSGATSSVSSDASGRAVTPATSATSTGSGGATSTAPALTSSATSATSATSKTAPPMEKNTADGWPADSIGATVNGGQAPAAIAAERQAPAPDLGSKTAPGVNPPAEGINRPAWLKATFARPDNNRAPYFRTDEQRAALTRITGLLDENPDAADKDSVRSLANRLKVLAELEGAGQTFGGPFIPTLHKEGARLKPWKRDGLPVCIEMAHVLEGYAHQRDGYHGPVTVFDRNGAWVGSAGTALVAHGALTHTGECEPAKTSTRPGYYLVTAYPWTESDMPGPLGTAEPGSQVWVPAPTAGLLAELADAGRWPDGTAADSWTGDPITLAAWGRLIRELRRYALEAHGYESGAYQAAKDAISMSLAMWTGELDSASAQPRRVWKKCKTERIDWRHQIITNSAAMMWRTMDRCRALANGNPDLAPLGVRNKDELLIPDNGAAELVTTTAYQGGTRPPVRVDNTGVTLGAFKIKSREDW